jgi:hypothetical protein
MSFTAARLAEFNELVSLYGSTITYKSVEYDVVADPVEVEKAMANSAWQPDSGSMFTISLVDWLASGMTNRSSFTYEGQTWDIYKSKIDPVEPTVSFSANLKK